MLPDIAAIAARFPGATVDTEGLDPRIDVPRESYHVLVTALHEAGCWLSDVTAVDRGEAVEVVAQLLASPSEQLSVHTLAPEGDLSVDTIVPIFPSAEYAEREVYDLFGVDFVGHPDMSRVLLPDHFVGHPLRKSFELKEAPW
jgi:NADH-quinone oxidoreductase subunit C